MASMNADVTHHCMSTTIAPEVMGAASRSKAALWQLAAQEEQQYSQEDKEEKLHRWPALSKRPGA
jgi:hypothetical protein